MIIKTPAVKPSAAPQTFTGLPTGEFVLARITRTQQGGERGDLVYGILLSWLGQVNYLGTIGGQLIALTDLDLIEVLPNSFVQVVE